MLAFMLPIALVVVVAVGLELVPVVVEPMVLPHVCSRVYTPVSFSGTSSCDDVIGKQTILTGESDR